ncbi:MAG TPA: hypothetical protein VM686_00985 [Polyangiaceae bacterium]|nr:hypothetical protein [Polyangiaceae bacterium]
MTLASHPSFHSFDHPGEVRLVPTDALDDFLASAAASGLLAVPVPAPGPAERGRLAVVIEEAIETTLGQRGACAPGVGAGTDLDGSLSDQLYRARLLEQRGLAIGLPSLDGIATLGGTLDSEDSAVLRWWLRAASERPVHVYVDEGNRFLGVYGRPTPLHEVVARAAGLEPSSERPPHVAPDVADSMASAQLAAPEELRETREEAREEEPCEEESIEEEPREAREPEPASDLVAALLAELVERHAEETSRPPAPSELPPVLAAEPAPAPEPESEPVAAEPAVEAAPESTPFVPYATDDDEHDAEEAVSSAPPPLRPAHGPLNSAAAELWPTWVRDLEGARGPKPLGAVERMFVSSYVPLCDAVARGIAKPSARTALEAWATSFAQSYREAFAALCVRGKRPAMVLDVPDLALRMARLHGARSVQLILVDGMRFDLGLRVERQLRALLGQEVALTERLLLWSALPANTSVQLDLLGRGPDALRDFNPAPDSEVPVARGKNAATPRRVKVGHRELLKLDLVEARLSEPGGEEAVRLDELADETADALAATITRFQPRTLVMVFGDHGFMLDERGGGTTAARPVGSRPEEVLVPGFAWLVGGLH